MRVVVRLLVGVCVVAAIAAGILVVDGLTDTIAPSDVIVILGNKIEANGTPSPRLKSRLDRGAALFAQGISPRILVSGGTGAEGYNEATAMRDYLVTHGVLQGAITVDSNGVDTFATAKNTQTFLQENALHSALVVSNYYHIPRAKLALTQAGVATVYSAHASHFEIRDLYSIARECIAYPYYFFRTY